MLLKEAAPAAPITVPLAEFQAHLRLGYGFVDDGAEDALLELYFRNAATVVEARTGQALIARAYLLQAAGWDRRGQLTLPVGPVAALESVSFVRSGQTIALTTDEWALEPGRTRQRVTGPGGIALRPVPHGALVEIAFTAGHGTGWDDVPDDLRQAVMLLAGHFYENRHGELSADGGLPAAVSALLAPHRPVRLGGAGGSR